MSYVQGQLDLSLYLNLRIEDLVAVNMKIRLLGCDEVWLGR
jgi:hypothetical protein